MNKLGLRILFAKPAQAQLYNKHFVTESVPPLNRSDVTNDMRTQLFQHDRNLSQGNRQTAWSHFRLCS